MEYEYAIKQSIPVISFIHNKPENIPAGKSEKNPESLIKLQEFREQVEKKLCKYWDSPTDLGSKVSRSLIRLIKDYPRDGWVKASLVPKEDTSKEILKLKNEIETLNKQLENYSEPQNIENISQGDDLFEISYADDGWTFGYSEERTIHSRLFLIGMIFLKKFHL